MSERHTVAADLSRGLLPRLLQLLVAIMEAPAPDGARSRGDARERDAEPISRALADTIRTATEIVPDYLGDITETLADMHWQVDSLRRAGLDCPVVRPADFWIPLALGPDRQRSLQDSPGVFVRRVTGAIEPLPFSTVDTERVAHLMAQPLASFLSIRALFGGGSGSGNVEVSNNAAGWNILHSPPHLMNNNAFGGPSTPVRNSLPPGNYHFAISNASQTIWDGATWAIPPTLSARPPHLVHVPLP